jgi:hypothetical protein
MQVNLLVSIEKQAEVACTSFNPQNCANLLWGFAKLGQPTATLLPAIAKRLNTKDLLLQCKPVEVRPGGRPAGGWWERRRAKAFSSRGCTGMLYVVLLETIAPSARLRCAESFFALRGGSYRL